VWFLLFLQIAFWMWYLAIEIINSFIPAFSFPSFAALNITREFVIDACINLIKTTHVHFFERMLGSTLL